MAKSPVFLLEIKSGEKKKDKSWYGCMTVLCRDSDHFDNWCVKNFWFDDRKIFEDCCSGVSIGDAIRITKEEGIGVVSVTCNDNFTPIEFEPLGDD